MSYDITDAIKEAIGQVAQDHELSAYAVMDLYSTVSDYVTDYLIDQQVEADIEADIEDDMFGEVEDDGFVTVVGVEDADPEQLLANAEEFIDGCERVDFIVEQGYSDHFLTGMRDRLNAILADNG